jgi:hypothetical protein
LERIKKLARDLGLEGSPVARQIANQIKRDSDAVLHFLKR